MYQSDGEGLAFTDFDFLEGDVLVVFKVLTSSTGSTGSTGSKGAGPIACIAASLIEFASAIAARWVARTSLLAVGFLAALRELLAIRFASLTAFVKI